MKTLNKIFLAVFLLSSNYLFSANEIFRSRISGFWTNPSTWEYTTNGGGTWITATSTFPEVISGTTEVRNGHNVTIPLGTPLAINQFTIRSGGTVTINLGATLTIGDQTSLDLVMESGSTILGAGGSVLTFTEGSSVECDIQTGANFLAPLQIDSGTAIFYSSTAPFIAEIKGQITVDAGQTLNTPANGYSVRGHKEVINNGFITGSNSSFRSNGFVFINNGTISVSNFQFDTTTTLMGAGVWTCNNIIVNSASIVTLNSNVKFGPASQINLNINNGGKLSFHNWMLTLDASTGSQLMTVFAGGNVEWSGAGFGGLYTKGTVNMNVQTGANFNAPLYVTTGITNVYSDLSPFVGTFKSTATVDAGATLRANANGYGIRVIGDVINNGTISGSSAYFYKKGNSYANNGTTSVANFNFDSTTTVSGTGVWSSSNIYINNLGVVNLANDLSFGSSSPVIFTINAGGTLNPNTRTCTFNGTSSSVTFRANTSSTTINSGTIQTQGVVGFNVQTGANFNTPLKVNTGTTTAYSDLAPFIAVLKSVNTIDAGATLNVLSNGYGIRSFGPVTNNGTVAGSAASFYMKGNSYANNGLTSVDNFNFDTTTSLSGTGTWSSLNSNINNPGNVSLVNSLSIGGSTGMNFNVNSNGVFNPNSCTAAFGVTTGTLTFRLSSSATVINSGLILTKGNVNLDLQPGSSFNSVLKVNTGVTTSYSSIAPHYAYHYNKIMIDTGATFNVLANSHTVMANDSVINNGTIGASGSVFRFFGSGFVNNGVVSADNFYFETIGFAPTSFHTVSGTGRFTSPNCNIVQSAHLTLLSTHKFAYVNVNSGGTLDITSNILRLTGGGTPITVGGTLITSGSTVEYNGTSGQTIVDINNNYQNLTVNNAAGVSLSGNLSIPGNLTITNGDLNLNGYIISLLPTAVLTETNGNTVSGTSGYITTSRMINAPSSLNVAGLGATITSAVNLGLTEIRRGHSIYTLPTGAQSIKRYFAFNPSNNNSLNATVVFNYDESELNGQSELNLSLFKSTNAGASFFAESSLLNTNNNHVALSGVNSLNRYTFGTGVGFINLTAVSEGLYDPSIQKSNLKDTIKIYMRNGGSPYAVVDSSKARFDSVTLSATYTMTNAPSGNYYIVAKHRNSIETWSKAGGENYSVGSTLNYNFTSAASQAFGDNMILEGTRWSFYSGDVNDDGSIDVSDLVSIYNDANNIVEGYVITDLNGDYFTDVADLLLAYNNLINVVSVITP